MRILKRSHETFTLIMFHRNRYIKDDDDDNASLVKKAKLTKSYNKDIKSVLDNAGLDSLEEDPSVIDHIMESLEIFVATTCPGCRNNEHRNHEHKHHEYTNHEYKIHAYKNHEYDNHDYKNHEYKITDIIRAQIEVKKAEEVI